MEIFVLWLVFSIIVAVLANHRGRSGLGWFLLACLISPLIAGLLVLIFPTKEGRDMARAQQTGAYAGYRKCPYCAEVVRREAIKCMHCGSDIRSTASSAETPAFELGRRIAAAWKRR